MSFFRLILVLTLIFTKWSSLDALLRQLCDDKTTILMKST